MNTPRCASAAEILLDLTGQGVEYSRHVLLGKAGVVGDFGIDLGFRRRLLRRQRFEGLRHHALRGVRLANFVRAPMDLVSWNRSLDPLHARSLWKMPQVFSRTDK